MMEVCTLAMYALHDQSSCTDSYRVSLGHLALSKRPGSGMRSLRLWRPGHAASQPGASATPPHSPAQTTTSCIIIKCPGMLYLSGTRRAGHVPTDRLVSPREVGLMVSRPGVYCRPVDSLHWLDCAHLGLRHGPGHLIPCWGHPSCRHRTGWFG